MEYLFKYISKIIITSIIIMLCLQAGTTLGACLGKRPVWGTGDDKVSCAAKYRLKQEEEQLAIEEKEKELKHRRRDLTRNEGTGSGTGNTNVILGSLKEMITGGDKAAKTIESIRLTRHQVRVELMPYVIPGAAQFDKPGMPEKLFFNGFGYEYYMNKNLGFGVLWQSWSKTGGMDFDPVTNNVKDKDGQYHDTAVFFPGEINRMKYTMYIPYVTINAELGNPLWNGVFRFGMGRTQVDVEFNQIDHGVYPYAVQPGDKRRVHNTSMMFDMAVERWTSGFKLGGFMRYISARVQTNNYLEYTNLGSAQIGIYVQFMLEPLGLL